MRSWCILTTLAHVIKEPCDAGVILSGQTSAACPKARGRWILAATILASSMAFIDGTVVNVAIPFLQKNLNATAIGVQWVVESYSLFLSALLLVGGSLGDRFGRRRIFCIGVGIFALASGACGFATGIGTLIIARAIQGIGGALLVPGSLALISASFDSDSRGRAIGTWSGFSAITTAVGPVLGGWLIEHVSWRAVFFINLPIALTVLIISIWHVPESRDPETGSLDWLGAMLATIGLGGAVFGLIESSRFGFAQRPVYLSLLLGVVSLVAFVFNEAHVRNPMLPLRLFRIRNFTGANILTLFLYMALSGVLFFFTLNLIQVQGYSATAAGSALLPFVAVMFALSRWSGGLVDRFGARIPLIIGPFIAAVGFAMFAIPSRSGNFWKSFLPAVIVMGIGMAISVAPLTTTVMSAVHGNQSGVASGINNAVARTAGLLAIAVFGVLMLQSFGVSLHQRLDRIQISSDIRQSVEAQRVRLADVELPSYLDSSTHEQLQSAIGDSFVHGFRVIVVISAVLAALGGVSSLLLIQRGDKSRLPGSVEPNRF